MISYRFGLDSTGLELAHNFHAFWGPVLFMRPHCPFYISFSDGSQVTYACLSTTLLLTVLVLILVTPFADINCDVIEEYMFR